ncbi:MAG TPA: tripartite tricarboxylate transporter substrate binding protein [Xanthobacteraceae bacterium]|nr:tripartite tricarboxylate transporter substrate binding protein [Xanthobacteraceae bacterium]
MSRRNIDLTSPWRGEVSPRSGLGGGESFGDSDITPPHRASSMRDDPPPAGEGTKGTARRAFLGVLAGAAALVRTRPAQAQFSANRPIRIIVPFAPAGSSDVLARLLQSPLQQALGRTVIVENRAGAGANIGTVEVARAEPDGYTLLLTSSAFVVNPALYKSVPYDPAKDFAPIATLPVAPNILATNAKGTINSLFEVVARAKAEPQKLNYASPGNGTTPQLAMELFKLKAGVEITNIPFNGGGPATQALLTGTVDLLLTALPGAQAQVQAGVMRGLAVTTKTRWVNLRDVPTFSEQGFPDVTLETEHFLLVPAGTPAPILERYTKAALAVLSQDDIKNRVVQLGYAPVAGGPDAVKERIAKNVPFFKQLIADAKIPQIE